MKKIAVLGSTGSIGEQTLSVIREHPHEFELFAICANSNALRLLEQFREFHPKFTGIINGSNADILKSEVKGLYIGADAACVAAALSEIDIAVIGVSGIEGLLSLVSALKNGKTVALANKESIVCGYSIIKTAISQYNGQIIPVDSEQSAIFQCLKCGEKNEVKRLILTASGGPFKGYSLQQLKHVTPEQALMHPTWNMGTKITIDSATMFNKGLEVIEASRLFDLPGEQIDVLIHPQSVVHSMVEFRDSSVIAQMSNPDMRLAIQYAMTYPARIESGIATLMLDKLTNGLTFMRPDTEVFKAIPLAYNALKEGKILPIVYNGANEKAVELFLKGAISFADITACVEYAMEHISVGEGNINSVSDIFEIDNEAKHIAKNYALAKGK